MRLRYLRRVDFHHVDHDFPDFWNLTLRGADEKAGHRAHFQRQCVRVFLGIGTRKSVS
jgi:hypothetical protein